MLPLRWIRLSISPSLFFSTYLSPFTPYNQHIENTYWESTMIQAPHASNRISKAGCDFSADEDVKALNGAKSIKWEVRW